MYFMQLFFRWRNIRTFYSLDMYKSFTHDCVVPLWYLTTKM